MDKETVGTEQVDYTDEEIKSLMATAIKRKQEIIREMNKFKEPMSFTVFTESGPWTCRNIAFWDALHKKDTDIAEFMASFLAEDKS